MELRDFRSNEPEAPIKAELGRIGIWTWHFGSEPAEVVKVAAELEELGYGALWFPNRPDGFELAASLLEGTHRLAVASGVLSIWDRPATELAEAHRALSDAFSGRFLLGLGVSHAHEVDRDQPGRYTRPLMRMREYLEQLDKASDPVPAAQRVLGALGPRMLELARDRAAGAHSYLGTVEHTRRARRLLGPGPLLAPELTVVLEPDPAKARDIAREYLSLPARWGLPTFFESPHYVNNWLRLGFTSDDFSNGGSDRLIDEAFAWGSPQMIRGRVAEHLDAGADHVCIQLVSGSFGELPLDEWRALASELLR